MLQRYDTRLFPFMRGQQTHITESYVSVPPALIIQDNEGAFWTLGFDQGEWRTGEYEFDVVRNGVRTGEHACRIEMKAGQIRIFGSEGWRAWNGRSFV
jgi:hypothetical protein